MANSAHHVLFIGARQSGKSSLTAAWYHIASRTYELKPDPKDDGADYIINLVNRVCQGQPPIPTPGGPGFHAVFEVLRREKHRFTLALTDYPGETVRAALDGDIDEGREQHRGRVMEDIEEADRIIFVFHPDELIGHDRSEFGDPQARQHENLLILKKFASMNGSHHVQRTWCYISHADVTPEDRLTEARNTVRSAIRDLGLELDDDRIICGASLIAATDRVGFPESGPVVQVVNNAMTTFETYGENGPGGTGAGIASRLTRSARRHPIRALVIVAILAVLVLGGLLGVREAQVRSQWATLLDELQRIEAENSPNHEKAQVLLGDLRRWADDAESGFSRFFDANVQQRADLVKARLEAVPRPPPAQGLSKIVTELTELHGRHGDNLPGFYRALRSRAGDASTDRRWTPEARREWQELERFAGNMVDGVLLVLDDAWLVTPRFWTRLTGRGKGLRIEIWVTGAGTPKPFDKDTNTGAAIETTVVDRVQGTDGNLTYRWSGPISHNTPYRIGDTLYLRVFHLTSWYKWNSELAHTEAERRGPDGLGWFNRRMSWGERTFRVNIHAVDASGTRVIAPDSLKKVFEG